MKHKGFAHTMYAMIVQGAEVLAALVLVACGSTRVPTPQATETPKGRDPLRALTPLPLSEPGPYRVGVRQFAALDASRGDRQVSIRVWYPAVWPDDASEKRVVPLTEPDRSGAPYPLIVSSAKVGSLLAPYLVTHGFIWAGVDRIDSYEQMNEQMIEQPLDILFMLEQVAVHPPEELHGMIDAEHTGVTGYSFDGYNALALSGARIDPAFYLAQCATPDATKKVMLSAFSCAPARAWDAFAAYAGAAITTSDDGLWQPMTDARIRAVMPMAGEGWWLFGDRGLAAVDRPILMLVATQDELYPENVRIFSHLGASDKTLISFVGPDHMMMVQNPELIARMAHFAAAFFGYHLQGRKELASYLSEDFVAQHADLAWGAYANP
ncbi:MAG: hypothetical protein JW934_11830 [Anaerolineae bacterium]|nr:hypothetical protein [Anaerolineae bacterium]